MNIMVAIPSATGMIPLKVMSRLISLEVPKGFNVNFGYVERMAVDKARNGMVEQCLKHNNDYIFFHDDDQLVPRDILVRLIERDKDIVGTPIPSRNGNKELAIYDMNGNRMTEFSGTQQVRAIGMGATLIKREVLEKVQEEYPAPFQFEITTQQEAGEEIIVEYAEDINFCRRAGDLGFEVWCTSLIEPVLHFGNPRAYLYDGEYKML